MTPSHERAQRGVSPSGVSLGNVDVSPDDDDVVVLDTVIQDDFARRRADNLDVEAAHYRNRAIHVSRHWGWPRSAGSTPLSVRIESGLGESC